MKLTFGSVICSVIAISSLHTLFTCQKDVKATQARATARFSELKPYIVSIDRDNKILHVYSDDSTTRLKLITMAPRIAADYNWSLVVLDNLAE